MTVMTVDRLTISILIVYSNMLKNKKKNVNWISTEFHKITRWANLKISSKWVNRFGFTFCYDNYKIDHIVIWHQIRCYLMSNDDVVEDSNILSLTEGLAQSAAIGTHLWMLLSIY